MNKLLVGSCVVGVVLVGLACGGGVCMSRYGGSEPPSGYAPSTPGRLDPRRAELLPEGAEAEELGLYGYVVLTQKLDVASGAEYDRHLAFCEEYMQAVPELPDGEAPTCQYFVTYWPLRSAAPPSAQTNTARCKHLTTAYDHSRIAGLRHCLGLAGRRGPVLVAQLTSLQAAVPTTRRLVLDYSNVENIVDASKPPAEQSPFHASIKRWLSYSVDRPEGTGGVLFENFRAGLLAFIGSGTRTAVVEVVDGCK